MGGKGEGEKKTKLIVTPALTDSLRWGERGSIATDTDCLGIYSQNVIFACLKNDFMCRDVMEGIYLSSIQVFDVLKG